MYLLLTNYDFIVKKDEEKRISSLENALEDERINREQHELRHMQDWENGKRK